MAIRRSKLFGLLVFHALWFPVWAQSSATYRIDRVTVGAGEARTTSAGFINSLVVAQALPQGGASLCNDGYVTGLGFWSVLGNPTVPIDLAVHKVTGNPSAIDLSWTGTADTFQVFRSYTPQDVLVSEHLGSEPSTCQARDPYAYQSNLIYYNIIKKP